MPTLSEYTYLLDKCFPGTIAYFLPQCGEQMSPGPADAALPGYISKGKISSQEARGNDLRIYNEGRKHRPGKSAFWSFILF